MAREFNQQYFYGKDIRMDNYAKVKGLYDNTKPIQGSRLKFGVDTRPLSVRRRSWETWYEKDGWVGMAFRRTYRKHTKVEGTNKYELSGYEDTVMPLLMMNEHNAIRFTPQCMYSYMTLKIFSALLPKSMQLVKYGAKIYIKCLRPNGQEPMYYFNDGKEHMTFVPYETKDGTTYYKATHGVIKETKVVLVKDRAKRAVSEFKAFLDYFQPMADMLGFDPEKNNGWMVKEKAKNYLIEQHWLERKDGEVYGERWIDAIQAFLVLHTGYQSKWIHSTNTWEYEYTVPTAEYLRIEYKRNERLYKLVRPFELVSVPIGQPFNHNYRRY